MSKKYIRTVDHVTGRSRYTQHSRSRPYPFSSNKQNTKKWAEFNSCGRKTVGKVS